MRTLAELVFGFLAAALLAGSVALGLLRSRLRRRLRLIPDRRTTAPILWLIDPRVAARLHRRLQRACSTVIDCVGIPSHRPHPSRKEEPASPLLKVSAELIDRAVVVDSRVLVIGRGVSPRRRATLYELADEVRSIEAAARRIHRLHHVWNEHQRGIGADAELAALSLENRLDAVEAAMAELTVKPLR